MILVRGVANRIHRNNEASVCSRHGRLSDLMDIVGSISTVQTPNRHPARHAARNVFFCTACNANNECVQSKAARDDCEKICEYRNVRIYRSNPRVVAPVRSVLLIRTFDRTQSQQRHAQNASQSQLRTPPPVLFVQGTQPLFIFDSDFMRQWPNRLLIRSLPDSNQRPHVLLYIT